MTTTLFYILASVLLVSLVSIIGIFFFIRRKIIKTTLFFMVSFAAGTLLGVALLDLLPEALEEQTTISNKIIPLFVLLGITFFFILEKFLYWHHHHTHEKEVHAFTSLNLIGDSIHNFLDGVLIAVSFLSSTELGIVVTVAVIMHEIPQEIGDFAILIYGGFSRLKALIYNFLTALTAIFGALLTYFYSNYIQNLNAPLTAFVAGGFIYIANADLIPEIKKEKNLKRSFLQLIFLIGGILLIWIITTIL